MQTEARLQTASKFEDDEDYDLIGYMALRADDPVDAELAWQAFYKRHIGYLVGVIGSRYSNVLDELCIEELATEATIRAFASAGSFLPKQDAAPDLQRAHVKAWLGTIATNLFHSELQKYKGLKIIYPDALDERGENGWEAIDYEASLEKEAREKEEWVSRDPLSALKKQWVQDAFDKLSEREQHILRVTLTEERPDRAHQRLPDAVSNLLKDVHKTTADNIRQIRKRAKGKIETYVKEMLEKYREENEGKG